VCLSPQQGRGLSHTDGTRGGFCAAAAGRSIRFVDEVVQQRRGGTNVATGIFASDVPLLGLRETLN